MDIGALQATLRRFAAELLEIADQATIALHDGPGAKTHVLVDWENVQPTEDDCRRLVPEATDVWLFHGPNQKNVGRHYPSFGDRATEIRIARTGKNALDFHLSFYIGYIASKHPDARFVVLSNDKGYAPMLAHAKELGFEASQSGFKAVKAGTSARKTAAKKTGAAQQTGGRRTGAKTAAKTTAKAAPAGPAPARAASAKATPSKKAAPAKKTAAKTPSARTTATKKAAAKTPARKTASPATTARPTAPAAPAPTAAAPAGRKSFEQVLAILYRAAPARRPRTRDRLLAQLASLIGVEAGAPEAEAVLARLIADRVVAVDDKRNLAWL